MTPDMLMQPFEQSFTVVPVNHEYFNNDNIMMMNQESYILGYSVPVENLDFRPTFYNPFEIKHRRRTSRAQLKILEKSFSENPKPNATVRRILAQQLDMTPRGVQIWFQNRRAKAKLLRRKSARTESSDASSATPSSLPTPPQEKPRSPTSYPQMLNNVNARSVATAAAASCIFDASKCASSSNCKKEDGSGYLSQCQHTDKLAKLPLHPLGSEGSRELEYPVMNDEWRRKSCPSLGSQCSYKQDYEQAMWSPEYTDYQQMNTRRMTAEDVYQNRYIPSFALSRSPMHGYNEYNNTSPSTDFFHTFNHSPISQQMTPKLSTGSPISVEGGYYDSCLDLILSSSPSPAPML
ncbi:Putative Homeobox-domain-containing protein [Rhizopus microsporus]|nr:Putative Homeobox-domain-containing protein [Rhizopus microsporus]